MWKSKEFFLKEFFRSRVLELESESINICSELDVCL